jgi:ribosomal protein S18 acetylase RimI-like enzyme
MIVRAAARADLADVALLLRDSFAPALRPYLIYAQAGIAAYLEQFVAGEAGAGGHRLLVAEEAGALAGFAEFRLPLPGQSFLSYVCVAPPMRRRGVARTLIETFLAGAPGVRTMELDVFRENVAAIRLYDALGFAAGAQTIWAVRDLPAAAPAAGLALIDDGAARFARFGFCELSVRWAGAARRLGRIGPTTLRCFEPGVFADDALLAGLGALVAPLAEALWIGPADEAALPPGARIVNRSQRMGWTIDRQAP